MHALSSYHIPPVVGFPVVGFPAPHETSHKCSYGHSLHIQDLNHTSPLMSIQWSRLMISHQPLSSRLGKKLHCQKWGSYEAWGLFFLRLGHAVCILHVHPPTSPLSHPKVIAGSDIMKLTVSRCIQTATSREVFTLL